MTNLDTELQEIAERVEAATEGPCVVYLDKGFTEIAKEGGQQLLIVGRAYRSGMANGTRYSMPHKANAEFFAHAFTDIPRLLAMVSEKDERISELRAELAALKAKDEWQPEIITVLAKLQKKLGDVGWICIEDKLYSEEGCLPSRQSTIQINNKMYGGESLACALARALPPSPEPQGEKGSD